MMTPTALAAAAASLALATACGSGPAPTAPSNHADVSATADEPSDCEGRRAEMVEWFGMGNQTVTLACDGATPALHVHEAPAHGEATETITPLDAATWQRLWTELEDAGWRTLGPDCPPWPDDASPPNTGVDLSITEGATAVAVSCNGEPTAVHRAVLDVFAGALERADAP